MVSLNVARNLGSLMDTPLFVRGAQRLAVTGIPLAGVAFVAQDVLKQDNKQDRLDTLVRDSLVVLGATLGTALVTLGAHCMWTSVPQVIRPGETSALKKLFFSTPADEAVLTQKNIFRLGQTARDSAADFFHKLETCPETVGFWQYWNAAKHMAGKLWQNRGDGALQQAYQQAIQQAFGAKEVTTGLKKWVWEPVEQRLPTALRQSTVFQTLADELWDVGEFLTAGAGSVVGGMLGGLAANAITRKPLVDKVDVWREGAFQYFGNIGMCGVGAVGGILTSKLLLSLVPLPEVVASVAHFSLVASGLVAGIFSGAAVGNWLDMKVISPCFGEKTDHPTRTLEAGDWFLHVDDVPPAVRFGARPLALFDWLMPEINGLFWWSGIKAGLGYRNQQEPELPLVAPIMSMMRATAQYATSGHPLAAVSLMPSEGAMPLAFNHRGQAAAFPPHHQALPHGTVQRSSLARAATPLPIQSPLLSTSDSNHFSLKQPSSVTFPPPVSPTSLLVQQPLEGALPAMTPSLAVSA
ncbi:MAG: hypothetical protein SFZ03_00140 [Candidatus Melainabacteria bacterium]|nr:hypothetical protein [Candidatus Melainabacteria bacterium]